MLKYSLIPPKTQSVDTRSSAPNTFSNRPPAIPWLCSIRDTAWSTEQPQAWLLRTEHPWGHSTDLQLRLWQKASVPSTLVTGLILFLARKTSRKLLNYFSPFFFFVAKWHWYLCLFFCPSSKTVSKKHHKTTCLLKTPPFPGSSSKQAASSTGLEHGAIPHGMLCSPWHGVVLPGRGQGLPRRDEGDAPALLPLPRLCLHSARDAAICTLWLP